MLGSRVRRKRKRITRAGIDQGWGYEPLLKFIGGLGRHGPLFKICCGTGFDGPLFNIIVWEDITLFCATGIVGRGDGWNKEIDVSRSPIHRIVGLVGRREDSSWRPGIIRVTGSALTTGGPVQAKGLRESWGASVVVRIGRESW